MSRGLLSSKTSPSFRISLTRACGNCNKQQDSLSSPLFFRGIHFCNFPLFPPPGIEAAERLFFLPRLDSFLDPLLKRRGPESRVPLFPFQFQLCGERCVVGRRETHNERRRGNQLGLSCFLHAESANFSISQTASGRPRFSQTFFRCAKSKVTFFPFSRSK